MKKFIVIQSVIIISLVLTALFVLNYADRQKATSIAYPLSEFPLKIEEHIGHEERMDKEIEEKLGVSDYLMRTYKKQGEPAFQLYVAFFEKQVTGSLIHSPQHCMPAGGWNIIDKEEINITYNKGMQFPANLMILGKGEEKMAVLYWYQSRGRRYANEYLGRFYLMWDAAIKGRTDGSLVRIIYLLPRDYKKDNIILYLNQFVNELIPLLDKFIPA